MKIQKWFILIEVIAMLVLSISCTSKDQYTTIDNPRWFSIDYPKGFETSINPTSIGSSPEVDFAENVPVTLTGQTTPQMVTISEISAFGVNGDYSDVVNYMNTVAPITQGKLVTKGDTLSVFKESYSASSGLGQGVFIYRDMGKLRTLAVWGNTKSTSASTLDALTHNCINMANSAKASDSWVSDGNG